MRKYRTRRKRIVLLPLKLYLNSENVLTVFDMYLFEWIAIIVVISGVVRIVQWAERICTINITISI